MNNIQLQRVQYMPDELKPDILYVSEEFGTAIHLCACGCGNQVVTPLGPTDWSFTTEKGKPTLYPSIGNWQLPCRSHYWITKGKIQWSYQWSEEQILRGRKTEEERRRSYFSVRKPKRQKQSLLSRIVKWLFKN